MMAAAYAFTHAAKDLLRAIWINVLSVLTIASSLLIVTFAFFILYNVDQFASRLPERFSLVVYLKHDLTSPQAQEVIRTLQKREEVQSVKFISKEEALRELKQTLKEAGNVLDGLNENPLSASLEVKLNKDVVTAPKVKGFADSVKNVAGVDDVYYGEKIAETVHLLKTSLLNIGLILFASILASVVFVTYSTVKILFYRKKAEIDTMKLLGATGTFIRLPFLIQGGVIGLLGGLLSAAGAFVLHVAVTNRLNDAIPIVQGLLFPTRVLLLLPCLGFALGVIGSVIAIGRLRS